MPKMDTPSQETEDFSMAVLAAALAIQEEADEEEEAMSLLAPVGVTDMTPSGLAGSSAGLCWVIGSLMQIQAFEYWIRWVLVAITAPVLLLVVIFAWQFENAVHALVADYVFRKRGGPNYQHFGAYNHLMQSLFKQALRRQADRLEKAVDIRDSVVKHTADFKFACAVAFLAFLSCVAFVTLPYAEKASFSSREWYNYVCFGIIFLGIQVLIVYGNSAWKNATLRALKEKLV